MSDDRMLSPEEAQQIVLDNVDSLGVERVPVLEALGRVLAVDVAARHNNPPHDNSAMDGYALRYADIKDATQQQPAVLEMVEDIPAGYVPQKVVGVGQTSRIMTGGLVPAGADTVVMVEDTRAEGERVEILEPDDEGSNIRLCGEDMRAGEVVVAAGTECGVGEISVLAAQQNTFVTVYRRPTVAIFSTGDELVEIDEPLEPGKIVNSNTASLAALCRAHGAVPLMLPSARDTAADTQRVVEMALTADFAISSGGVSVGEYDYVKQVLDAMGADIKLWRVAMKPGKPLFFCLIGGKPYFGVPGNPVSSMMSFLQFVRPAIRKVGGYSGADLYLPEARAVLDNAVENDGNRRNYLRAQLRYVDRQIRATTRDGQGSHMITSMLGANGFVVLEPEQKVAVGGEVKVQLIGNIF